MLDWVVMIPRDDNSRLITLYFFFMKEVCMFMSAFVQSYWNTIHALSILRASDPILPSSVAIIILYLLLVGANSC